MKKVDVTDVADSLKKQLAAKLLFNIFDPKHEITETNSVQNIKLLTVLVDHYAKATAELKKNESVGCIWECTFKVQIAKQLTLRKLQTEGEKLSLNEGPQQEIH